MTISETSITYWKHYLISCYQHHYNCLYMFVSYIYLCHCDFVWNSKYNIILSTNFFNWSIFIGCLPVSSILIGSLLNNGPMEMRNKTFNLLFLWMLPMALLKCLNVLDDVMLELPVRSWFFEITLLIKICYLSYTGVLCH